MFRNVAEEKISCGSISASPPFQLRITLCVAAAIIDQIIF
jgi:hypothetical protein